MKTGESYSDGSFTWRQAAGPYLTTVWAVPPPCAWGSLTKGHCFLSNLSSIASYKSKHKELIIPEVQNIEAHLIEKLEQWKNKVPLTWADRSGLPVSFFMRLQIGPLIAL